MIAPLDSVGATPSEEARRLLDETRAFLAAIVESSEDSIISIDFGGVITTWNKAAEQLYGYSREEAIGKPLTMLTLPEDLAEVLARIEQIKCSSKLETFETVRTHKDGSALYLSITVSPVKNSAGEVIGVSTIARDITARHKSEAALRASEEQFRRAIEDAPIPVIMQAEDGQVLKISRSWTELTGYTQADISTFEAWINRAYGPGADLVRDHVHRLFSGEVRTLDVELDVVTRTEATRRWAFSASAPGTLRDGRRFIVGMALDISERQKMEEALRQSQERLQLIVENAREYAIVSLDLHRQITSWNSGAEAILGYFCNEAIGESGDMIFTPEDYAAGAHADEAAKALRDGRAVDERWHVRKDGSRFWGSGMMMAMRDKHDAAIGFVKIFRDKTAEVLAQEALEKSREELWSALQVAEQARQEAEAAGRAKDRFLAMISHELRTPLNPILIASRVLTRRSDLPPMVLESVEMIQRNVLLEAEMIDELLDLTRISHGKMELNCKPMDLHEAVLRAEEVVRGEIEERGQRLTLALEATEHTLTGDFKRLQQVFWNLLRNASKFTSEGGRILVHSRSEPDKIVVEVRDTGIGFAPDAAERIFAVFEQADRHVTREFGGLGLGLAIAKASVEAHNGSIRAYSSGRAQGAVFVVRLPLDLRGAGAEEAK